MSKPLEVDEPVQASVTQPTEIEEDESRLVSGTILFSRRFILTSSTGTCGSAAFSFVTGYSPSLLSNVSLTDPSPSQMKVPMAAYLSLP